jgi:hypothetical protein
MIMAVCSDRGYVQLLQPFQGDPLKTQKIVLLTSCNTVIHIQNLAYSIVNWPTVFRSHVVSTKGSYGLAGPCTKGVTVLENFVQMAIHSPALPNADGLVKASPDRQPPEGQVLQLPITQTSIPSQPGVQTLVAAPPSSARPKLGTTPHARQRKRKQRKGNSHDNEDAHIKTFAECGQAAACTADTSLIANPVNGGQQRQADEELSEEPDCRLIHVFDMPIKSLSATRALLSQWSGIPLGPGSVMRMIVSSMAREPALRPWSSSQKPFRKTHGDFISSSQAPFQTTTAPSARRLLVQPQGKLDSFDASAPLPSRQATIPPLPPTQLPFIHVPMPDRAQEPQYDADRFLFQQSPQYLTYNHKTLTTIISYARRYYHLSDESARAHLYRQLELAEFLTTRLWLAQEIQTLEDQAVDRQHRCSRPSTFRGGDAWMNDWQLYSFMARALREKIDPALGSRSRQIGRGGLARMDWAVLLDWGITAKSWSGPHAHGRAQRSGRRGRTLTE